MAYEDLLPVYKINGGRNRLKVGKIILIIWHSQNNPNTRPFSPDTAFLSR